MVSKTIFIKGGASGLACEWARVPKAPKKSLTYGFNYGKFYIEYKRDVILLSSSRARDSSTFVPAIPDGFFPVCESRFFELNDRVTVFDEIDHQFTTARPSRKIFDLYGQERLY